MAFADYKPDYVEVKDASGKLVGSVRPLNDVDFILLWRKHPSAMDAVLAGLLAAVHRGKQTDLAAAMSGILFDVPDLVTDAICIASDEADNGTWDHVFAAVSVMPIGLRISALNAVIQTTSEAEGGLDKVLFLIASVRPAPTGE